MTRFALVVLLFAGCASIQSVTYSPQPTRVSNPAEEIKTLILANTVDGCVAEAEVKQNMLLVRYVCSRMVGNRVARLDKIRDVVLEQSGEWYRCRVVHTSGEDFAWTSKSLDDMQHMVDAFVAISGRGPEPLPSSKPSMM